MTTKLQDEKVKQESLVDLAKQAGLDARVYPHSIVGYELICFEEWIRELNINWRVKDEMNSWESRNDVEKALKLLKRQGTLNLLTENEKRKKIEKIVGGIREKRRNYIESKIDNWPQQIYARRYYLSGNGLKQKPWTLPLSRGVLLTLLEAQETKQFCRFEIWEPHEVRVIDPILIGFSSWHPKWSIGSCKYTYEGRPTGNHYLPQCRVTYKMCAWE